jgi:DNA polymerase-3 subunit alpha
MNYNLELKNYSTYSCEVGMLSIEDIVNHESSKKSGVAFLTDHSTLSGVPEFADICEKSGIKPVIGVTFNVSFDDTLNDLGEITLYAKNKIGYDSLKKLVSNLKKTDDRFILEKTVLENHVDGLIAVTGGFETTTGNLLKKSSDDTRNHLKYLKSLFNEDLHLEIQQRKDEPRNIVLLNFIQDMSKELDLPVLCTNNNRFNNRSQFTFMQEKGKRSLGINADHSVLNKLSNEDFVRTQNQNYGFYFKNNHNNLNESRVFSNKFENLNILKNSVVMPKTGDTKTLRETLREKYKYFISNIPKDKKILYKKRIKEELDVIEELGFDDYFLIFNDIIKSNKGEVGFALRGSSVGSLVVHVLGMSDVDPVENGLLFERFLNKGRGKRHELPDIDLETTDTSVVFDYIQKKYSQDNVAMLMTNDKAKNRTQLSLAYDVLKNNYLEHLGDNFENDFKMLKSIIEKSFGSQGRTITEEIENNYQLKNVIKVNKNIEKIIKVAQGFDNQILRSKRGNAGVVINNSEISNIFSVKKDDAFVISNIIEVGKEYVEKLGLIKLDILSNKYLEKALKTYSDIGVDWNEKGEKYKSKSVYDLLSKGHTVSINQLKNPKQADLCRDVGIDKFSDLVAVVALLRPGVDKKDREAFVERKRSPEKIKYPHPKMENILGETYGVIIYDEQIMKIVQEISGFTPEESDEFRSAIKKNNIEKVKGYKDKIINGAVANGIDKDASFEIYKTLENITGKYTFTKAHATVYSDLIYKQTWLKANYPNEYMKNYLLDNKKEFIDYIDELGKRSVKVLSIDINRTNDDYKTLRNKKNEIGVDFSFNHVFKNDRDFVKVIVDEREKNGIFENIFDYIERILPKYSGIGLLSNEWRTDVDIKSNFISKTEKLIDAGAFDSVFPKEIKVKMLEARSILKESLEKGVEDVLKPFLMDDYEYVLNPKNILNFDDLIKKENLIYGISLTEMKIKKKDKEVINTIKPQ